MAGSVRNHKSREIADPHVIINCERWRIRTSSQIAKDGGSVRNRRLREMTDPYVITNCERPSGWCTQEEEDEGEGAERCWRGIVC